LRSLFWLANLDELIHLIDEPAYVLEDEVRVIPTGVGIPWIVSELHDEGKIPSGIFYRFSFGVRYPRPRDFPVRLDPIPSMVTDTPTVHRLVDLFPYCRPQHLPAALTVMKYKAGKPPKNSKKVEKAIGDFVPTLGGHSILYRTASRTSLAALMAYSVPTLCPQNYDNELGPGIYTSGSLGYVLRFSAPGGVILVFKDSDFRNLNVWEPTLPEWQDIVATWTHKQLSSTPESVPENWKTADIIRAPISEPNSKANRLPVPGKHTQIVATSHAGCQALAASWSALFWLE
jgi:hypothetical protein